MKKIIIAAAFVCAAVITQASQVSWGITSGKLDAEKFASGTLYLCTGTAAPSLTELSVAAYTIDNILAFTGDKLAVLNTMENSLELVSGAGKLTGSGNNVQYHDGDMTGAYKVYAVAISDGGKYAAVSTLKTLNIQSGSQAQSNANWSGTNFTTYAATVPEPTSGLLLLLGVAGMALRRRRA